ncbi:MAG: fibronectin type III-like domain-contianing protein, partial [Planctomycetota bacterium]
GPQFPFGYGLSYTTFEYDGIATSRSELISDQRRTLAATVTNTGDTTAAEVVQLYVRDLVASSIRPVRELKAFRRVTLEPGESRLIEFVLDADDLSYASGNGERVLEPGDFEAWIGGDSEADLSVTFTLTEPDSADGAASVMQLPTATAGETPIR